MEQRTFFQEHKYNHKSFKFTALLIFLFKDQFRNFLKETLQQIETDWVWSQEQL